jgi:hypothetical protein
MYFELVPPKVGVEEVVVAPPHGSETGLKILHASPDSTSVARMLVRDVGHEPNEKPSNVSTRTDPVASEAWTIGADRYKATESFGTLA